MELPEGVFTSTKNKSKEEQKERQPEKKDAPAEEEQNEKGDEKERKKEEKKAQKEKTKRKEKHQEDIEEEKEKKPSVFAGLRARLAERKEKTQEKDEETTESEKKSETEEKEKGKLEKKKAPSVRSDEVRYYDPYVLGDALLPWLLSMFLYTLPIVNIIYLIYCIVKKEERKEWAKASLIIIGVQVLIVVLLVAFILSRSEADLYNFFYSLAGS